MMLHPPSYFRKTIRGITHLKKWDYLDNFYPR